MTEIKLTKKYINKAIIIPSINYMNNHVFFDNINIKDIKWYNYDDVNDNDLQTTSNIIKFFIFEKKQKLLWYEYTDHCAIIILDNITVDKFTNFITKFNNEYDYAEGTIVTSVYFINNTPYGSRTLLNMIKKDKWFFTIKWLISDFGLYFP